MDLSKLDKIDFSQDEDLKHLKKKLKDKVITESPIFEYFFLSLHMLDFFN